MISVWNLSFGTVLLRNGLLCCGIEENRFDHTNAARRSRLEGPWEPGKARWREQVILDGQVHGFGRGERVWRRPQKVNLGMEWLETEDEGKCSCENCGWSWATFLW